MSGIDYPFRGKYSTSPRLQRCEPFEGCRLIRMPCACRSRQCRRSTASGAMALPHRSLRTVVPCSESTASAQLQLFGASMRWWRIRCLPGGQVRRNDGISCTCLLVAFSLSAKGGRRLPNYFLKNLSKGGFGLISDTLRDIRRRQSAALKQFASESHAQRCQQFHR